MNSHCTGTWFGVDSVVIHQPVVSGASNRIGVEYADPPGFTGGDCPSGRICRYSDAALAAYDSAVDSYDGRIARTLYADPDSGSLTINPSSPWFFINAEQPYPVSGPTYNKIGRRTGWTRGLLVDTCFDTNVLATNITMLCQYRIGAGHGSGDSGSPVFVQNGNYATLYGILWGGSINGFVFSSMEKIKWELGSLQTTTNYTSLTAWISSGPTNPGTGWHEWTSSTTGGDGTNTYAWSQRINHQEGFCEFQTEFQQVGTASSLDLFVTDTDYNFELRLVVSSGGETRTVYQMVFPSGTALPCPD